MTRKKIDPTLRGLADVIQRLDCYDIEQVDSYALALFACQEFDLPPIKAEVFEQLSDEHRQMIGQLAKAWLISNNRWPDGWPT